MILSNAQLSHDQIRNLTGLMQKVSSVDNGLPCIYLPLLKKKRETKANFLYYDKTCLAGFLSIYFFYDEACEVTLLVAPAYRHQGIAKELLHAMLPLIKEKGMKKVLFSAATSFKDNKPSLQDLNYAYSEYHMQRCSTEALCIKNQKLTFKMATSADINYLIAIDKACFDTETKNMRHRFNYLLMHQEYSIFLAYYQGQPVGKLHSHWGSEKTTFSDIAILPPFQGQGLGSELLRNCINEALLRERPEVSLDVEAANEQALRLYQQHGFTIKNQYDYWSLLTQKIEEHLK